ncbi:MAG: HigA family addiction module antitoxin [Muribaculaceae bacterium]
MATITYSFHDLNPSVAIHPGAIIKDELDERGLSQRAFASLIDCSYSVLNEILNGKRPVSADLALRAEAALGVKAYMLVDLQAKYNLQKAAANSGLSALLSRIRAAAVAL